MLANVPSQYKQLVNELRKSLLTLGEEGEKLVHNFWTDPRPPVTIRNRFLEALKSNRALATTSPREVIDICIEDDMIMKGPTPKKEVPEELGRLETLKGVEKMLARKGALRTYHNPGGNNQLLLDKVKDGSIADYLPDRHCNEKDFLWGSEAEEVRTIYRAHGPDVVRDRLGLVSGFNKKEIFFLLTFPKDGVIQSNDPPSGPLFTIPTVIEAGDYHAFTPAPGSEHDSGYTIDLNDGEYSVREWVCRGVNREFITFETEFMDPPSRMTLSTDPPRGFFRKFIN